MNPPRLTGRRALITGASRGIGRAVAECFVREGAIVAINYHGSADEAEEALKAVHAVDRGAGLTERPHMLVGADMGEPDEIERMVAEVVARWGGFDTMIYNAGIQSPTPGDSFEGETLERILAVNLTGAAYAARAAIAHFLSRPGGGTVISTSSVHQIIPKPDYLAYAMSKAGLGHLTRTLALEFADRGIRVNAVAPGAVVTDINAAWIHDPEKRRAVESHIPMGYAADPDAIAPVFAFLASDEASYITGQTIFACGGLTLYGDFKENWSS